MKERLNVNADIKSLRKRIQEIVKGYKITMLGKYSIRDIGGKKWEIEYSLLIWKEEWNDFDFFSSGNTQKCLFKDIERYEQSNKGQMAVEVTLKCNGNENQNKILLLNGTDYR